MRFVLIFGISLVLNWSISAQELDANISVNTPQLQQTDPEIFKDLETQLQDFLNNQAFTNEYYEDHEKIKCNFQLTIRDELGNNSFTADLIVQSSRPVYGSEYETVLLNYSDSDVKLYYNPGTVFQFAPGSYVNNLSSILSYYALMIIGYDYDSFSPKGGDPYFQMAENIVTAVPSNVAQDVGGWQPADSDRNRFWLVENMLNPKVSDFRLAMYRYHLQGLDVMHANAAAGQASINDALNIVLDTRNAYPNNMVVQLFAIAKSDEVVEVMAKANRTLQKNASSVMTTIDPANRANYAKLK